MFSGTLESSSGEVDMESRKERVLDSASESSNQTVPLSSGLEVLLESSEVYRLSQLGWLGKKMTGVWGDLLRFGS